MKPRRRVDREKGAAEADRAWVQRMSAALNGDERAYRRLLMDAAKFVKAVARRSSRGSSLSAQDLEDIVQETLLAIHIGRARWRPEAGVLPWIAAIARYKTIDALRMARNRKFEPIDAEDIRLAEPPPGDAAGARIDVERLMAPLRPRQQTFVSEVMLRGCTVAEIAQSLGMTPVAGRVALHRALRTMAQSVGETRLRRTGAEAGPL